MCAPALAGGNQYVVPDGNRYAVLVIQNPTHLTINYAIRWGYGRWTHCSIEPGMRTTHSFRYTYLDQTSSPKPAVKFDCDLSSGVSDREYELKAYAAPWRSSDLGKKHEFRIIDGRELDLVTLN
jgi:hypothetical protein